MILFCMYSFWSRYVNVSHDFSLNKDMQSVLRRNLESAAVQVKIAHMTNLSRTVVHQSVDVASAVASVPEATSLSVSEYTVRFC